MRLAWPARKHAAELYRDERDVRADRPRRAAFACMGWQLLVLREDRDLTPDRLAITMKAISKWASGAAE